jgi:hypothetical protein
MEWDFKEVEDVNLVPEAYRGLYAKNGDGKFVVMDAARPLADAYVGQTRALGAESNKVKALNKESTDRRLSLKAVTDTLKEFGVEIDDQKPIHETLKTHIGDLSEKIKGGAELKVNLAKVQAEAEKRVKDAQEASAKEMEKKDKALNRYLVDQNATVAIVEAKGSTELLMPHIRSQARVVQDGEDYVVRIVDEQGDIRTNGKGGFMSVADLISEMKTKPSYARAFESEAPRGGGASNTPIRKPVGTANKTDGMSSTDKISAGLSK